MKLRSLFLSTLVVCAFASCSKDGDGIEVPVEPVDASISFAATTLAQTKAEEDAEGKENKNNETFINELHAFIFKVPAGEDNTDESKMLLVGEKKVSSNDNEGNSVTTINHIIIKVTPNIKDQTKASTDIFKVVLVANPGVSLNPKNLAELKGATLTKSIAEYPYVDSPYLPMVSDVIEITNIVPIIKDAEGTTTHNENWIDGTGNVVVEEIKGESISKPTTAGTIPLTRLVARVQVESIKSRIHEAYEGSSFELTNLSLVNVRPLATMEDGINSGDYEYVKGFESVNYGIYDGGWIYPDFTGDNLIKQYESALSKKITGVTFSVDNVIWTPDEDTEKFYSYAFPNVSPNTEDIADIKDYYYTALLITGIFKRNATAEEEVKNFRVILKDGTEDPQVKRNNVYKLTVTLTGEGSSNENKIEMNAHVSTEIVVANWFVVKQDETDVN